MKKCNNIGCEKETKGKNIYCSMKCRNIYVNKYLRDYSKIKLSFSKKRKEKEKKYLQKPKFCKECGKIIPYLERKKYFCNSSCGAKHTNKNRKGLKYNWSEKGLENLRENGYKMGTKSKGVLKFKSIRNKYVLNPKKCKKCGGEIKFINRKNIFCSKECRINYNTQNRSEYRKYYLKCLFDFSLNEYPEQFDFDLIKEHGWYSPSNSKKPNLNGVSRDHIYPIRKAFRDGIDSELIRHPGNCQLLRHNANISKGGLKSKISIIELRDNIKKHEKIINNF